MRCKHGREHCSQCAEAKNHGEKTNRGTPRAPQRPRTFRSKRSIPAIGRTFQKKGEGAPACHVDRQLGLTEI